jgi:hypothetical protein
MKNVNAIIDDILSTLPPKQRRIVAGRFGLKNGKTETLQEIGDEIGITRERVRQIEEQALKKIREKMKTDGKEVVDFAKKHLLSAGGVKLDEDFLNDVLYGLKIDAKTKNAKEKVRFILLVSNEPMYAKEDDKMNAYWYTTNDARKKFLEFVNGMTKFLATKDKTAILTSKSYLSQCKDLASCHFLAIPKHFGMNIFGDFGLKSWPEIEPKTIRDRVYLVLRKHGAPLHFTDIAKYSYKYGLDKKAPHVQTVHNELIKDHRFVLVGRGMYALREHGFEPGTVKDVLVDLLKKNGPQKVDKIIELVKAQRLVKENTVILNLQNKNHFKKLDDGRFSVREA